MRFVIRLKNTWKPTVDLMARGQVTQEFFPGTDPDVLLEEAILVRDGRAIDADVHVGEPNHPWHLRLIGVHTAQGDGFFLTNLPPRIGPRQVADRYHVRWEVERSIRLDTSVHRLDQIDAECFCSVKTLWHASLIASMIAALFAHKHHLQTQPPQPAPPDQSTAPLAAFGAAAGGPLPVHCSSFDRKGPAAKRRWQQLAAWLTHTGECPMGVVACRSWIRSAAGTANPSPKGQPKPPSEATGVSGHP